MTGDLPPDRAWHIARAQSRSPILFVVDHASNALPAGFGSLGLAAASFSRHIAWDIGALQVAHHLGKRFASTVISGGYTRLLVDLNRFPEAPECIPASSDGLEIPGNQNLSTTQRCRRIDTCFWPYQRAIGRAIERIVARGQVPVLISIHSFTPALKDATARPWHIGILWNERDARLAGPLLRLLRQRPAICVGENQPYHASQPQGYTVKTHAEDAGHPHVLLEIRQDLIGDETGVKQWANLIGDALQAALAGRY